MVVVHEISTIDLAFINKDGEYPPPIQEGNVKGESWGWGGGMTWVNNRGDNFIFKEGSSCSLPASVYHVGIWVSWLPGCLSFQRGLNILIFCAVSYFQKVGSTSSGPNMALTEVA